MHDSRFMRIDRVWIVLAAGVALAPVGLSAPSANPDDRDEGYEDPNDDWFYDYYERTRGDAYDYYDERSDPFEWDREGLFA